MMLDLASAQRSYEQLLELVSQLLAENERLRAEIEQLKRKDARSAAPSRKFEVKAYRVKIRDCRHCQRKVRGQHPEIAPDQFGATAHRLGSRAQAAAHALHYGEGIPQRKVPDTLRNLTRLKVMQGALTQLAIQ
jgi:hypothetical protein